LGLCGGKAERMFAVPRLEDLVVRLDSNFGQSKKKEGKWKVF
jgi:hypothetical protein